MIPTNISKENILEAFSVIDEKGIKKGAQSSTYDVIFNDKRYPPKFVISLANKFANGYELDRSSFKGGEKTKAFEILRNHGFLIERKPFIKDLVYQFLEQAKTDSLTTSQYPNSYRGLKIKVSFGVGNQAQIPWIAFLKPPNKVMDGIYPGVLYYKEENLLILTYGRSETNSSSFRWGVEEAETINEYFQKKINKKPRRYGESLIKSVFDLDQSLDIEKFESDLDELIDTYKSINFNKNLVGEPATEYKKKSKQYWLYSPGEGAEYWEEFYNKGIMGVGWDFLGDLKKYDSKSDIVKELQQYSDTDSSKKNDSTACDDFANRINIGDIIIVKKGLYQLVGLGEVSSDYYYDESRDSFKNLRKVNWIKKGKWPTGFPMVSKTLTDVTHYESESEFNYYYQYLLAIINDEVSNKFLNDEIEFKKVLSLYADNEIYKYFDFLDQLLDETNIVENDERVSFSCARENLSLTVGQRPSWRLTNKKGHKYYANADIQLSEDADSFNGNRGHFLNMFKNIELNQMQREAIIRTAKIELSRTNKTGFERHNNLAFEKAAFDYSYRNELFKNLGLENSLNNLSQPQFPLNQILYGPPGTGKTYRTKEIAVEIANPDFRISGNLTQFERRKAIVDEYDRLFEEGQIVFTTFHQSFSYEDFVEGIKPIPPTSEGEVGYKVMDGIFKKLCKKASEKKNAFNFDQAYSNYINDVIEKGTIELETPVQKRPFQVRINSNETSVAIPKTESATEMGITKEMLKDYIVNNKIRDWKPYTLSIGEFVKDNYGVNVQSVDNDRKNYVLIIDEINRGNVSSILGELITLLEPDKRAGGREQIFVELPYSKIIFSVPANIYIIGTMNTADRSVEALDTALRRRFVFEEVMPIPDLLKNIEFDGFNLSQVLITINERIEALLDRDHTIGHSYFIKINSGDTEALQLAFENKIIPLLQEYFYHDYEKIALILGEGFVELDESNVKFAKFKNIEEPELTSSFKLKPVEGIEAAINALLNNVDEEN